MLFNALRQMKTNFFNSISQIVIGLPRPHRIGIAALCFALGLIALSRHTPPANNISNHTHNYNFITSAEAAAIPSAFLPPQSPVLSGSQNEPKRSTVPEIDAIVKLEESLDAGNKLTPIDTNTRKTLTITAGDTLNDLFKKAGVEAKYMYHLLKGHPKAKSLAMIYPGHQLEFVTNQTGKLAELHHVQTPLKKQIFTRTIEGYEHALIERTPDIKLVRTGGTIKHSLYAAAKEAQLEDKLIMELAEVFGWDIDFALDIRQGDSFNVVYEEHHLDGKKLSNGAIVSAEFINQGDSFRAVRYQHENGRALYYTPEGKSMRKAFLRAPVDFRRISSSFNPRRLHPITKRVRPHRGIDYAAKTGTPVWSSGDGKVIRSGYTKYNGHYVVIQHGGNIQTKYLHLHKRKVKTGQRVRQKQLIGSVGSTGMSTAPHLHYEFLLNGVHRNPRTIVQKLPKAQSINKKEKERFLLATKQFVALLDSKKPTQVASNGEPAEPPSTKAM